MDKVSSLIPASKSLLIRALLVRSYNAAISIHGESDSDDVCRMRSGLENLFSGQPVDCGDAATVFRLLALRAARMPGVHVISGTDRLLQRPHAPLIDILQALGSSVVRRQGSWLIQSNGWQVDRAIQVDISFSSQFLSGVLLNSWLLPQRLTLQLSGVGVSEPYARMSEAVARQFGLAMQRSGNLLSIEPQQGPSTREFIGEMDMSCAFAVVALSLFCAGVELTGFPSSSLQPDWQFLPILRKMGVKFRLGDASLSVKPCDQLQAVNVNLRSMPDLFPVLATLCAFAEGNSQLYGAPHLQHKESDRLAKTAELITKLGRQVELLPDGLRVFGVKLDHIPPFDFDVERDHRLAMAAAVAQAAGVMVRINRPEAVNKSFPSFWQVAERLNGHHTHWS